MLKLEQVSKSYGKKLVLHSVNASFEDGRVHGIIGLNGAGKTTLFNCICGLLDYDGVITHTAVAKLKDHIGYLPTEPYFFPRIKGSEYLAFIQHAKNVKGINDELVQYFDLPLNEYIDGYSTGMKRKLAFIGAMIGDADIYILDEPFNGVDIKSNLLLKQHILKLKEHGKTVLLSSHITSSLTELCDEVHLLKDGSFARHYLPGTFNRIELDMMEL